jgi:Cu+-exporting ATPase
MVKDPVCDMALDEQKAIHKSDHKGHPYYFCSAMCKALFAKEPERYLIPPLPSPKKINRRSGSNDDLIH